MDITQSLTVLSSWLWSLAFRQRCSLFSTLLWLLTSQSLLFFFSLSLLLFSSPILSSGFEFHYSFVSSIYRSYSTHTLYIYISLFLSAGELYTHHGALLTYPPFTDPCQLSLFLDLSSPDPPHRKAIISVNGVPTCQVTNIPISVQFTVSLYSSRSLLFIPASLLFYSPLTISLYPLLSLHGIDFSFIKLNSHIQIKVSISQHSHTFFNPLPSHLFSSL